MTTYPKNGIWKQINRSDKYGDIWSSYNLDLNSNLGALRVSPRFILNMNTADNADFGIPCAVKNFTTSDATPRLIWVLTGDHLFYSTGGAEDTFTKYDTPSHPGNLLDADYSDMEIFQDLNELYLFGTQTTIQYMESDGTSTGISNALATGGGLHDSIYFRATNKLYVVDNSAKGVTSINTSRTSVLAGSGNQYSINNLADGNNTYIIWINATSSRIWIGTLNLSGEAFVYAWDGSQASGPNEAYKLTTTGSFSCVIKDDVPWIVDTEGRLLAFNGGTFVEKDRFPMDISHGKYMPQVYKGTQRFVHYNGMTLVDNKINMLVNTAPYDTNWPASNAMERMPSGVWEYTEETGLYHKASLGLTKVGGTIVDYGQEKLNKVGVLSFTRNANLNVTAGSINGSLMAGAQYYTDATTSTPGLFYDDFANTLLKGGYVITRKIFSQNIEDTWQKVYIRHKPLLDPTDYFVAKYRTQETNPSIEIPITWTSTTTFTFTEASFDFDASDFEVGDEVEVLQGIGSGKTSHIVTAVQAAGTVTITVDETYTGATGTSKMRIQKWKKIGKRNDQDLSVSTFKVDKNSTWVQFKIAMQFTGANEVDDFVLTNQKHEPA